MCLQRGQTCKHMQHNSLFPGSHFLSWTALESKVRQAASGLAWPGDTSAKTATAPPGTAAGRCGHFG